MPPHCLIIRTAGTNCDLELAHAFERAGATTQTTHLNELIENPSVFDSADLVGFPGGFSYGDDIAAGRILANRLKHRLLDPIKAAIERGVPMIGICNGFQVLTKMGLLPDPSASAQLATLADNAGGRFIDRWSSVTVPSDTRCVWTKGLDGEFELPIAHGEGRFTAPPQVIEQLQANGQVAIAYTPDDNPNGSTADIAGVCDPSGLVFGLMPHPERYTDGVQHPSWTRKPADWLKQTTPGLKMFENAVAHATKQAAVTV